MILTVRKKWNWQVSEFRNAHAVAVYLWARSVPRYIVEIDGRRVRLEPPYELDRIERQILEQKGDSPCSHCS